MISIFIADDHAIVRSGLKQIVATTADIAVVGEAAHGSEVVDKLRGCRVDLLLLDMTMPGISGVDLIRRVRAEQPDLADPGVEHPQRGAGGIAGVTRGRDGLCDQGQ
jgi:YesN/AraC family two-component response regulator